MGGLFEKYSFTQEGFPNINLKPVIVKIGSKSAISKVEEYLAINNYLDIKTNLQFNEVFGCREGLDYTISAIQDGGKTIINVAVYCENKIGRSRKALVTIVRELRALFIDSLADIN